jgi:hypothetical protein
MEPPQSILKDKSVLIFLAIVALFFLFGRWAADAVFFPWAHADPPLLAQWSGRLTAGNGERFEVTLDLRRANFDDQGTNLCNKCPQIDGAATMCDAMGRTNVYQIFGTPSDRQGRRLHLGAKHTQDPPPDGLELDTLICTWDGADTLTLAADFIWRRGVSGISSSSDPATQPVPLPMRRVAGGSSPAPCRPAATP